MKNILVFSIIVTVAAIALVSCSSAANTVTPAPNATLTDTAAPTSIPATSAPASPTTAPATPNPDSSTPAIDGKTLLAIRCTACHSLDRVNTKSGSADEWKSTVDRMVQTGAELSSEEAVILVQYLAENYK